MLHPAQKIASFFVAKKLIPAQDYEWAVYGLQRRLLAAVFYPILFLIGLLVSDVYSTVLFFVVFTSLRHRVGGHHAGSAIRCLINSSLIVRSVLIPADYSRMAGGGAFTGGNDRLSCDWPGRSLQ